MYIYFIFNSTVVCSMNILIIEQQNYTEHERASTHIGACILGLLHRTRCVLVAPSRILDFECETTPQQHRYPIIICATTYVLV